MKESKVLIPKVLVCQRGARHRYAIPALLEERNLLAGLYTDSSFCSPLGRLARLLTACGFHSSRMDKLISRNPRGIPATKVHSFDGMLSKRFENGLARTYIRRGLQGANMVYSMAGEEFAFLQWAKQQGARIILDVFIHPGTLKLLEVEMREQTGEPGRGPAWAQAVEMHFRNSFALADVILCPSEWVADGVSAVSADIAEKIQILPYGNSLQVREHNNRSPEPGRVLFAGRDALRKGLHYLASAAGILRDKGLQLDVRVAGVRKEDVPWMEERDQLNFLGSLPLDQMSEEFMKAEMLVLPSLSEGQAGVVLEAMASGCPVIITRECGVDLKPGCGMTVPARDPQALADAMGEVLQKRELLTRLAEGALDQAREFSMDAWGERLSTILHETFAQP